MPVLPNFATLERLRSTLAGIRRSHVSTMNYYVNREGEDGFWHQPEKRTKSSLASTATCVSSLVGSNLWHDDKFILHERARETAALLISKRTSALLDDYNAFSLSFVAEGVLDLLDTEPTMPKAAEHREHIDTFIVPNLIKHLMGHDTNLSVVGSISLGPYPPSAYLTQLVYRVLIRSNAVNKRIRDAVHVWARSEINKQIVLIDAKSRTADPLQLAYAVILAVATTPDERASPEDKEIFRHALAKFFGAQLDDGSWPLSRPLFHYPEVGNAHCFEYELLVQLLGTRELWDDLMVHMAALEKATTLLFGRAFDLDPDHPNTVLGWASGHHPQLVGPESWSTASVYHFAHLLDRFVAEAVRRVLFAELNTVYKPPIRRDKPLKSRAFAKDFLDADLHYQGKTLSLRSTLLDQFVKPIDESAFVVSRGGRLARQTPMSAIWFGPPGTSKTQLAGIVSDYIGWPLLMIDPSYLVSSGMDRIQAMANRLFTMLAVAEQVVVLLDEFDEMGRDRSRTDNLLSRFITTAMLPKLAEINKERKIVFLLATNYISGFDAAFSRGGRFDMLLQVMPPNYNAKKKRWPEIEVAIKRVDAAEQKKARKIVGYLTFDETSALAKKLGDADNADSVVKAINNAWGACTLNKPNDIDRKIEDLENLRAEPPTWLSTCETERGQIRIPGM